MLRILLILPLFALAYGGGYPGGWDPRYCCYPPGDDCCPPEECPKCADVAILIDRSGSIGNVRWDTLVVPFLQQFATSDAWTIGFDQPDEGYQVGVVSFSSGTQVQVLWASPETASSAALNTRLGELVGLEATGVTETGLAMKRALTKLINTDANRPDCEDMCIVVTDGAVLEMADPTNPIFNTQLPLFKAACDSVIAVGIESTAFMEEQLKEIATSDELVILVDDFEQLEEKFTEIVDAMCPGGGSTSSGSDCCPYDMPFYAKLW